MPAKRTTKKITAKKSVPTPAPKQEESIYKRNFDSAVRELEAIREELLKAPTLNDLAKADLTTRGALLTLQKYTMDLGYYMRDAVEKRRAELVKGA